MVFCFYLALFAQIGLGSGGGFSTGTDSLYVRVVKAWPFSFTPSVATDGKKAYAAAREGVYVVSRDAADAVLMSTIFPVKAVRCYGGCVYALLEGRQGMSIFRGEDKGTYPSDANCIDMAFSGSYGFIAAGEEGMIVVSLADPLFPQDVAYFDTPGYAQAIDVSGNYAAIADGETGVLVDITNPKDPKPVRKYDTKGLASGVAIAGKYVFVADGKEGLVILDFSKEDPLVGGFKTTGFSKAVKFYGKYVYIADGDAGLRIIDVSDPANPIERAYYNTAGFTSDLALTLPLVYVADGQYGFLIMENMLLKHFK
ncbi:MAG: LVIVD repeat-containing protein [Candidatus Hydrothermia bacterium]